MFTHAKCNTNLSWRCTLIIKVFWFISLCARHQDILLIILHFRKGEEYFIYPQMQNATQEHFFMWVIIKSYVNQFTLDIKICCCPTRPCTVRGDIFT